MAFGVLPTQAQAVEFSLDEFSSFLGLLLRPGEDQEVIQTWQNAKSLKSHVPLMQGPCLARPLS